MRAALTDLYNAAFLLCHPLMYCCVNFGSQTICTTPSTRCCDKDVLILVSPQPTAQNTAYIPSAGLFEVGLYTMTPYSACHGEG